MTAQPDISINNVSIVNENQIIKGTVIINDQKITDIIYKPDIYLHAKKLAIDGKGKYLFPGIIDDQVHFRQPGLTHKGDILSESKAAVAGGVTSFMDMPNTIPQTTTNDLLEEKFKTASSVSSANYSFYLGATNSNLNEIVALDVNHVCGIKIFMGSSTGDMVVENVPVLESIFKSAKCLIATHCEDDSVIRTQLNHYKNIYGDDIPVKFHPSIRSREACYKSSALAVSIAKKYNTKLHVLHLSTKEELDLFAEGNNFDKKRITAEVCVHHLLLDESDYAIKGNFIKWNPAIKSETDKNALLNAVKDDRIDIIATDHAPHTLEEKSNVYTKAPSGGPFIQHSLPVMLELYKEGKITMEKIAEKMCHNPALLYQISDRGFIRKNHYADLVLIDINDPWTVNRNNILYKCGWSPIEGKILHSKVIMTFVNGHIVFNNGVVDDSIKGIALKFNR